MADLVAPPQQRSTGRVVLGIVLNLALVVWFLAVSPWIGFVAMATDVCAPGDCDRTARVAEFAFYGARLSLFLLLGFASWQAWSRRTTGGMVLVFIGAAVAAPLILFLFGVGVEAYSR